MPKRCWIFFAVDAKATSLRKGIARRVAEVEPVVIVERGVSAARSKSGWSLPRRVAGNEYRPLHLPERIPILGRTIRNCNIRRIRAELDRLCPHGNRFVCYDSPAQHDLVGELNETCRIYLATDDWTVTLSGDPIPGELEAERKLLARVDRVICIGHSLPDVLRPRVPEGHAPRFDVLDSAFDERLFDPAMTYAEPDALQDIPRPRGVVPGHVSERIDWEGVAACRQLRPDVQWVFVGPADEGMAQRVASIGGHLRPKMPVEQVPGWIQHSDFCAVPYRLNAFTQASSPLKAMESLALGAPTLSTRVPVLERFDRAIQWVREGDGDSYRRAVENLLAEGWTPDAKARRQAAVASFTLGSRVEQFLKMCS
jgi:glycosyltransferase involved in cell wall biosynthesis